MKRRILLADDSVTIQKVIELTFMDEDYEVRAVSNGDEAVKLLPELKPDFVIADVHMPGANGYEVCRRSKQLHPDVPVLLLVGTFEPFDEGQARAAGADSHLKKPFDSQELLQRVDELIAARPAAAPAAAAGPTPTGVADWAQPTPLPLSDWTAEPAPPPAAAPAAPASPAIPDWMSQPAEPAFGADTEPGLGTASIPQFTEEPAWGSFELEPEPAPSPFAVPPPAPAAPEPFDREPSFSLEPDPGYQAAAPEPVFSMEQNEPSFAIREDVFSAPSELSFDEAPQDRYLSEEPAPAWDVPEPEPVYPPAPGQPAYEPSPAAHAGHADLAGSGNGRLSDDEVDRIARRVVELLGDRAVRDVAWEVIPDMAEVIIRDRLRELESQVE
ncbi:MAG: response regulator transcription factor [Thermoanaerobaculia bacterium]